MKGVFMEQPSVVYIPTNYTDAGKIFGMFETRNVAECMLICIPVLLLLILLSPFGLTGTIILCTVAIVPLGGFSLIGVQDYSLFTFLRIHRRFKKRKRILTYRGLTWKNRR